MVIIFLFSMALVVAMTMCILVLGVTFLIDKIILTDMSRSNNWCLQQFPKNIKSDKYFDIERGENKT